MMVSYSSFKMLFWSLKTDKNSCLFGVGWFGSIVRESLLRWSDLLNMSNNYYICTM